MECSEGAACVTKGHIVLNSTLGHTVPLETLKAACTAQPRRPGILSLGRRHALRLSEPGMGVCAVLVASNCNAQR